MARTRGSKLRPAVDSALRALVRQGVPERIARRHFGSAATVPVLR